MGSHLISFETCFGKLNYNGFEQETLPRWIHVQFVGPRQPRQPPCIKVFFHAPSL